jgi:signal transduction histidine kinase
LPQGSPVSVSHGTQGFTIEEVVRKYGILVDILLDELAATGGALDTREWQVAMHCVVERIASDARRRNEELRRQTARHVAFIAHELRNSLGTVGSAIVALRLVPTDESLHGVLDRNLRRLRELVDDVLTADRVASHVDLQRERLDLAALLCEAVEDARAAGESRTVKISLEADTVLQVEADRRLLLSIGNLLSNAVKFSHPGATVRVRARREVSATIVEVQDECGGLPDGNIEILFEPLVQRGEDRNGFGLGLAIVRQAMSAHGGRVSVRNEPGEGCTFVIALPAEDDRGTPAADGPGLGTRHRSGRHWPSRAAGSITPHDCRLAARSQYRRAMSYRPHARARSVESKKGRRDRESRRNTPSSPQFESAPRVLARQSQGPSGSRRR